MEKLECVVAFVVLALLAMLGLDSEDRDQVEDDDVFPSDCDTFSGNRK